MIISAVLQLVAGILPLLVRADGGHENAALLFLGARQILYRMTTDLGQLIRQSALGDMYVGNMVALAEATALDQAMFPICKITAPLIGGALALRGGLRLPFVVSSVFMSLHVLVSFSVRETLPRDERSRLQLRATSPISFFRLFRRSRTMTILGAMTFFAWIGETGGQPTPAEQVCNLHKAKILGWYVKRRCTSHRVHLDSWSPHSLIFFSRSIVLSCLDTTLSSPQKHCMVFSSALACTLTFKRACNRRGVLDRSRYESVNSVCRVSGLKLIAPAMKYFRGSRGCMTMTLIVYFGQVRG
eukprot:SAG31_NODE_417_length_15907_cov_6.901759_4_plen_300_part_00